MADKPVPEIDLNPYIQKLREMGLFIQDIENGEAYPNDFWFSLGYSADEMKDAGFLNYIHPEDLEKVRHSFEDLSEPGNACSRVLFRIRSREGEWHWVLSTGLGVKKSEDGKILNYMGFDHDVTPEVESRKRAEKAYKEVESLMKATEIISANLDLRNTIDAILKQAADVFSLTSASVMLLEDDVLSIAGVIGINEDVLDSDIKFTLMPSIPNYRVIKKRMPYIINNNLLIKFPAFVDSAKNGIKSWMGIPLIYKDRVLGMMSFDHAEENHFDNMHIRLACAFANQVSIAMENARLFEEVKKLAVIDELTGCYSRRHFFEALQGEYEKAKRYRTPLSLILFDIDDFKQINDTHGHLVGDQVLKKIARLSSGCLRKADIFGRYGGEEFVVLMPSTGIDEAYKVSERIRHSIYNSAEVPVPVTLSLGCTSLCTEDSENVDNFIHRADTAMYESKSGGKNRTTIMSH